MNCDEYDRAYIYGVYNIKLRAIKQEFHDKQHELLRQYITDLRVLKEEYKRGCPEWYEEFGKSVEANTF